MIKDLENKRVGVEASGYPKHCFKNEAIDIDKFIIGILPLKP